MTESAPPRLRYVPKGGYLVDFEKRVTPKLRRLLEREKAASGTREAMSDGGIPALKQRTPNVVRPCAEDQESACMAMVVWSADGSKQTELNGETVSVVELGTPTAPCTSTSSTSTSSTVASSTVASSTVASSPPQRSSWKPPGCLRQTLWKRPGKAAKKSRDALVTRGARTAAPPPTTPSQPCTTCVSVGEEKEALQQRQQALHLKTIRVESLAAKCKREMKEFEAYKEGELKRLADMREAIKVKSKRDALAETAKARASSQQADVARLRIKAEELEEALDAQRLKNQRDKEKHMVEMQRYRDEIRTLKEEVSELNSLVAASSRMEPTTAAEEHVEHARSRTHTKTSARIDTPSTPGSHTMHTRDRHQPDHIVHIHENSTVEKRWGDGSVQYLYENGDVRQSYSSGVVEYFYSGIECWNTSYPDGDNVYYFNDGRRECHGADGTVQILVDGHQRAYGCCGPANGHDSTKAVGIPVDTINPKLLHACPRKI